MSALDAGPGPATLPDDTARQATARTIAAVQQADGAIPWFAGGHTDPWDHVECVMALNVAGLRDPDLAVVARRGLAWLVASQGPDGAWPARTSLDTTGARRVVAGHDHVESNFCAYPAVGVAHHWLATGRRDDVARWFPMVAAGLEAALSMQRPDGTVAWARGRGGVADDALVTSCASMVQSLRAGILLADVVGQAVPEWELAAGRLAHALVDHPGLFADRARFSMDWYYPVLGGVVRGAGGVARVVDRWGDFVVAGLGIRCVEDQPWVTGAETCELALALQGLGAGDVARRLVADMQHLRTDDGSYWTGYVWPDHAHWPVERSTWTGATVLLACDALAPTSDAARIFEPGVLPEVVPTAGATCEEATCPA